MIVMDVSVKQTSKDEVSLSIKGLVHSDKLRISCSSVSSVRKLFCKKLDIVPRNSPARIISRFDQLQRIETTPALKEEINEAETDVFNVELEALVITS